MKECLACGKEFQPPPIGYPQLFCSEKCKAARYRMVVAKGNPYEEAECRTCKATYKRRMSTPSRIFCSKPCRDKYRRIQKNQGKPPKTEVRQCKTCGADFSVVASTWTKLYCSMQCRPDAPKAAVTIDGENYFPAVVRGRPVPCSQNCGRTRLYETGLCEQCQDERYPVDNRAKVPRTMRHLYEATCLMCARQEWHTWSIDELKTQRGTRYCMHCNGRVMIDRADIGNIASPMIGHSTSYARLAMMGRRAG